MPRPGLLNVGDNYFAHQHMRIGDQRHGSGWQLGATAGSGWPNQ